LAPLHLLALLHNHTRRPDSTTCDGFFSSPECSSRSASFDDFGDAAGGDDVGEVVDAEEQQLRDELVSSTTLSLSSSSSTTWTSTDSGEWSDWEDPLWVKDDNLLHSSDRDLRHISTATAAVVKPAAGQASGDTNSSSSPQPARRPTTTATKKTKKSKRARRRKRQQAVVRPALTAEQPTEPAHAALTERRGNVADADKEDDDDERVWRKRMGVEAVEAQTEELRLSVADDPVAAAAAVVLDLALDSPFSSADEVPAISPPLPTTPPTLPTAIAPEKPEAQTGVALNSRPMHNSEAAFRLPARPSMSSAPMPATPCLADTDGGSLPTGRHRAVAPPRPPRAFAPAASDGAVTLAKRPWAEPTLAEQPWATARESLPVVVLSSGGGSRLRDMQLIREMIAEQHRVAARKKRSKQATAPATPQETTRLSTTTTKTTTTKKNEMKKKKKNEDEGKEKGSREGKRGKLKRKMKLWNSLRRLKEKTAGGGEGNGDGGGDGGVSANNSVNNMADIGQVYVAAMADKGVRSSATAIPTRRTKKPATKNEAEENAPAKKNEAKKEKVVEKKEMNDEANDIGEVLSLSSASGQVMKVPVLNMTGLGSPASPTTAAASSPTTTTWLVSSASMSAVPLSPGPAAYDATLRPTSPAGVAHRPRNVSDPTGGSAAATLSSAESLSPRRRVWQAMTTPVVTAAGNRFRRNSRRFDHATNDEADPLEWVASPLVDLLRQRQLGGHHHHRQQPQPSQLARGQLRDYRTRSLHLPASPVAAVAHLDHLADGERTLQSTA
jgi:hypothetical protein